MIRPGFLSAAERGALIVVARDGLVEHRVARRANAIVLLNDGWNCEEVGSALLLDDDTVREWFGVYQRQGMAGLRNFGHEGSSCQLRAADGFESLCHDAAAPQHECDWGLA